jgi:mutator protein MutT
MPQSVVEVSKVVNLVARCAVRNERGEYLLARETKASVAGKWSFPGGKVDMGELPMAAFLRELTEETGYTAVIDGFMVVQALGWDHPAGYTVEMVFHAHAGEQIQHGKLDEISEIKWFTPAELAEACETKILRNPGMEHIAQQLIRGEVYPLACYIERGNVPPPAEALM